MVNFKEIVKTSNLYNFHSHTQFCDGHADMEDFVVEAIAQNFSHYGFSPHSPVPIDSSCNMSFENVDSYCTEFERLRCLYSSKIHLYKSMEIDYLNSEWNANNDYFQSLDLDYRISSVHFIPSFHDKTEFVDIDGKYDAFKVKMKQYFDDDIEGVVRSFYRQSMSMIENGGFDIIGHFDKIGHNASHFRNGIEDESWYQDLVKQAFDAILDNQLIVEVNTKAWEIHNRFFPNERFFSLLKKYNVPLVINSDAHYPALINTGRNEVMSILAEL